MSVKGPRPNSSSNLSSPTTQSNSSEQTFEEIFRLLDVTIKNLLRQTDYMSAEVFRDLRLVQKQTRYSEDVLLHHHVVDKIVHAGIGHVFLRSWHQLSSRNFLTNGEREGADEDDNNDDRGVDLDEKDGGNDDENGSSDDAEGDEEITPDSIFRNLQYVLSIVWNCSDSSIQLCDALVRSSVVYEMLVRLSDGNLVDAEHFNMEESTVQGSPTYKRLYLMKAYLGILHNIMRHCPDGRRMFSTAGGLGRLQSLARYPHEVVRAKTYLIMSYVASSGDDEDTDFLDTADDIASFIVAILREALGSVNHFVVRYAFWASEIASGLNHLAINDANKVRLGRLGVIQLYASMLLSGDDEEKSLAASGIWILLFHQENKRILQSDQTLVKTLTQVASRCTSESISRSLRGALWVAQSSTGSMLLGEENGFYGDDDPSQEHIMISYHWSAQKTMIKVRDALYSRGYKVWFDVDNMRGSTLEAMALAVERSAVVIICMSQSYKESPNCRTEAEYAFKMRKDIVPIITQSDFYPDGWLGMLAGTKLYFDFSPSALSGGSSADEGETECLEMFNLQVERLVREIGSRGKKKKKKEEELMASGVMSDRHGNKVVSFHGDDEDEGGGEPSNEEPIVKESCQQQLQQQAQLPRPLVGGKRTLGKIRADSGISSAEVASSILGQSSPRCHKCGAIVGVGNGFFSRFPTFSVSSSTPEFEEPRVPLLLPSPTPLHTYRSKSDPVASTSSLLKKTIESWSVEQVSDWVKAAGLGEHVHLVSGFTGLELLAYRRMMEAAPEFFYGSLREAGLDLVHSLRFSAALERMQD